MVTTDTESDVEEKEDIYGRNIEDSSQIAELVDKKYTK